MQLQSEGVEENSGQHIVLQNSNYIGDEKYREEHMDGIWGVRVISHMSKTENK